MRLDGSGLGCTPAPFSKVGGWDKRHLMQQRVPGKVIPRVNKASENAARVACHYSTNYGKDDLGKGYDPAAINPKA